MDRQKNETIDEWMDGLTDSVHMPNLINSGT